MDEIESSITNTSGHRIGMRCGEAVGIPSGGESPHGGYCIYGIRRLRGALKSVPMQNAGSIRDSLDMLRWNSGMRLRSIIGQHMNSEELILVTGATGFLGVQLVRELLARHPQARLALLIRDRAGQPGQQQIGR